MNRKDVVEEIKKYILNQEVAFDGDEEGCINIDRREINDISKDILCIVEDHYGHKTQEILDTLELIEVAAINSE